MKYRNFALFIRLVLHVRLNEINIWSYTEKPDSQHRCIQKLLYQYKSGFRLHVLKTMSRFCRAWDFKPILLFQGASFFLGETLSVVTECNEVTPVGVASCSGSIPPQYATLASPSATFLSYPLLLQIYLTYPRIYTLLLFIYLYWCVSTEKYSLLIGSVRTRRRKSCWSCIFLEIVN